MSIFTSIFGQKEKKTNEGELVINKLKELGYFNLTDDKDIDGAKKDMLAFYDKFKSFDGKMFDDILRYVDYRFYYIDAEDLFEVGGLVEYLDEVKPTFERMGLKFFYENEIDTEEGNYWKHAITINGKEYIAYEYDMEKDNDPWGRAYINFINILNDVLKTQNSTERVYPIKSENDGRLVFLTEELFNYVSQVYPKVPGEHPMSIDEWKISRGLKE